MQTTVYLDENQIADALRDYIDSRLRPSYTKDFTEIDINVNLTTTGKAYCEATFVVVNKEEI